MCGGLYACCGLLLCSLLIHRAHFAHGYVTKYLLPPGVPCTLTRACIRCKVCRCRRPSSPGHVFRPFLLHALRLRGRTSFVCGRPVTGAARPDGGPHVRGEFPCQTGARIVCIFLVKGRHQITETLTDWPTARAVNTALSPRHKSKVFSCFFWPEVPDFCRPLRCAV